MPNWTSGPAWSRYIARSTRIGCGAVITAETSVAARPASAGSVRASSFTQTLKRLCAGHGVDLRQRGRGCWSQVGHGDGHTGRVGVLHEVEQVRSGCGWRPQRGTRSDSGPRLRSRRGCHRRLFRTSSSVIWRSTTTGRSDSMTVANSADARPAIVFASTVARARPSRDTTRDALVPSRCLEPQQRRCPPARVEQRESRVEEPGRRAFGEVPRVESARVRAVRLLLRVGPAVPVGVPVGAVVARADQGSRPNARFPGRREPSPIGVEVVNEYVGGAVGVARARFDAADENATEPPSPLMTAAWLPLSAWRPPVATLTRYVAPMCAVVDEHVAARRSCHRAPGWTRPRRTPRIVRPR